MIGAVVLAAGRSTRMGAQKLLLPLESKAIIAHVADELLACSECGTARASEGLGVRQSTGAFQSAPTVPKAPEDWRTPRRKRDAKCSPRLESADLVSASGGLQPIIVVVGRDGAQIQQALRGRAVSFAENPDPDGDMLSSVRCGLRALPASCGGILVALGDQPGLTRELLCDLIRAFHQTGQGIIVPTHGGHRGHPVLFAARFRNELFTGHEGVGLRGLLDSHAGEIFEVPVSSPHLLEDLDTPEDYQRQRRRAGS